MMKISLKECSHKLKTKTKENKNDTIDLMLINNFLIFINFFRKLLRNSI